MDAFGDVLGIDDVNINDTSNLVFANPDNSDLVLDDSDLVLDDSNLTLDNSNLALDDSNTIRHNNSTDGPRNDSVLTEDDSVSGLVLGDDWIDEPILECAGPAGVLSILKTDPNVIRDAPIDVLRKEMAGMSKEEKSYVMAERKALRNRLSASRCTKARQLHMHALQKQCDELAKENARLKSILTAHNIDYSPTQS